MAFNTSAGSNVTWSQNFIDVGLTTIVWGTEQIAPTGLIVVSANEEFRVEEIDIEQGAGFEAAVNLLNKGSNVELNCIYDTNVIGNTLTLTVGTVISLLNPFGASVPMLVVGIGSDQARKREGMIKITAKSYNAISNPMLH